MPFEQPVHGVVKFMHIDFPKLQFLRERVLDRFRIHACRTTEFRTGRKNPIGNHGHDETTLPARPCGDELIESDVSHGAEHSRDIPMRQASVNLHRASFTDERLPRGKSILDDGEQIVRQVGDVGNGLMLDLSVLPKGSAEVRRNVNLAFVGLFDFCDMHRSFVWVAHGGFVAAGKTKSRTIWIFSGYTCNFI